MSKVELKEVNAPQNTVETAHKEIIAKDQEQNRERANQALTILPEEAKNNVMEACKYSSYFPNPITKPFMRRYILTKLEFPTLGIQLAQSLTECNVRIDNLINDAYSYEKSKLEAEAIEIEIEQLAESIQNDSLTPLEIRRLENQIALQKLEKANKQHSLNKTKLAALARYNEAMGWKACVEEIMGEMGVASLDEVNFNQVRMDEMDAKIKKWGELQASEMLEMTPSKLQVIYDNQDSFQKGFFKGKLALDHQQLTQQIPQAKAQLLEFKAKGDTENANALVEQIVQMEQQLVQIEAAKKQFEIEESSKKLLK